MNLSAYRLSSTKSPSFLPRTCYHTKIINPTTTNTLQQKPSFAILRFKGASNNSKLWVNPFATLSSFAEGEEEEEELNGQHSTATENKEEKFVYSAPNPGQAAAAAAPIAVFLGVTAISFMAFPLSQSIPLALAQALASGAAIYFCLFDCVSRLLDVMKILQE
ncbi:hypothetical protein Ahy_B03g062825 [Arachis hypogaea]|uniref:Uncharacterized protein n=1 Tax=Arachis hypogaea TaxID=3818 RepID=A0A444ZVK0_ARAHY|nr:hypothetical protein Ahy_B03g062825 [Arachis hypogaea]